MSYKTRFFGETVTVSCEKGPRKTKRAVDANSRICALVVLTVSATAKTNVALSGENFQQLLSPRREQCSACAQVIEEAESREMTGVKHTAHGQG